MYARRQGLPAGRTQRDRRQMPRIPTSYGSDSTINYELGLKGENEARTVAFDVTAFHIDWDDIQLLAVEWHRHQYERRQRGGDGVEVS